MPYNFVVTQLTNIVIIFQRERIYVHKKKSMQYKTNKELFILYF